MFRPRDNKTTTNNFSRLYFPIIRHESKLKIGEYGEDGLLSLRNWFYAQDQLESTELPVPKLYDQDSESNVSNPKTPGCISDKPISLFDWRLEETADKVTAENKLAAVKSVDARQICFTAITKNLNGGVISPRNVVGHIQELPHN